MRTRQSDGTSGRRSRRTARHRLGGGALVAALSLGVAACGITYEPEPVRRQAADPTTFQGALTRGYLDLAAAEAAEGDWQDADVFLDRARRVSAGDMVLPEAVDARQLPPEQQALVADSRSELISLLDRGGRLFAAEEAAGAQIFFDCWVQEAEEDRQPDDIASCRNQFRLALRLLAERSQGDVLLLLPDEDGTVGAITVTADTGSVSLDQPDQATLVTGPGAEPVAPVVMDDQTRDVLFGDAIAAAPEAPARFLLYFEVGGPDLTAESASLLAEVEAEIRRRTVPNVSVIGHSDTVGPAPLNERLAAVRAEAVRQRLLDAGIPPARVEAVSFGESLPLVDLGDEVDEPLNRRVEVIVR